MTYKARLEQLLLISIKKSNALIDIVRAEGQSRSELYTKAQAEWEASEKNYVAFLKLMEHSRVNPNDSISPIRAALKARMKIIAAALF